MNCSWMESKTNIEWTYLTVFDHRPGCCSLKGACLRQYEPSTTGCNNMAEQSLSEKMLFMTELAVIFLRRGSLINAICNASTEHACAQSFRVSTDFEQISAWTCLLQRIRTLYNPIKLLVTTFVNSNTCWNWDFMHVKWTLTKTPTLTVIILRIYSIK